MSRFTRCQFCGLWAIYPAHMSAVGSQIGGVLAGSGQYAADGHLADGHAALLGLLQRAQRGAQDT